MLKSNHNSLLSFMIAFCIIKVVVQWVLMVKDGK